MHSKTILKIVNILSYSDDAYGNNGTYLCHQEDKAYGNYGNCLFHHEVVVTGSFGNCIISKTKVTMVTVCVIMFKSTIQSDETISSTNWKSKLESHSLPSYDMTFTRVIQEFLTMTLDRFTRQVRLFKTELFSIFT